MFASTGISLGPTESLVVPVSHEWARIGCFHDRSIPS